MTDTGVPAASGPWAALNRARDVYSRIAFFIGIALLLYALYILLLPVTFAFRGIGRSGGFWGQLVFAWKTGVLFHPAFFQQAVVIFATGIALISRDNAWRWGTVLVSVAILAIVGLVFLIPFATTSPSGRFPLDFHIPVALILVLLLVPRTPEAIPRQPTMLSRTIGIVVLFHGLTAIILYATDPLILKMLAYKLSGRDQFDFATDASFILVPVLSAMIISVGGIGVGLRRPWGTVLIIVGAGIGLYTFLDGRIFGYRRDTGSFGAPHLHQIVMLPTLLYLALTLRRKSVSKAAPRVDVALPPTDPIVTVPAGDGWAETLRPILMSDGHLAPNRRSTIPGYLLLALIIVSWATIVTVLPRVVAFHEREILAFHIQMLLAGLGIGLVIPIIRLIGRRMLGIRAARAEDRIKPPSPQRPILYLRSFRLDEAYNRPPTLRELLFASRATESAEQIMTKALDKVGPVIAIGRPGETIPPAGAARFYSTDETWRDKVANAAAAADIIVWTTGFGAGLAWEIEYLQRMVPRERLIIWAHPHLLRVRRADRETEWRRFAKEFATKFRAPLPAVLGRTRFFRFAEDGALIPIPSPYWSLPILLLAPWRSLESMRQAVAARTIARLRQNGTIGRATESAR